MTVFEGSYKNHLVKEIGARSLLPPSLPKTLRRARLQIAGAGDISPSAAAKPPPS